MPVEQKQLPGTMSPQQMLDTFLEGMGMGFLGGVDPIGAVAGQSAEAAGAPPLAALIGSIGIPDPTDIVKLGKLIKNLPKTLKRTGADVVFDPSRSQFFLNKGTSKAVAEVDPSGFLDLTNVGGGGETLSALDELAEILGLQARRGVTPLSQAGAESVNKAVDLGRAVPLQPGTAAAGATFPVQSAGTEQGLEALIDSLVSKIAPGYQDGGQVDENAVLQFILQGLI